MTDSFPITPPPDLIEDWIELAKPLPQRPPNPGELAIFAARWGADQQLELDARWLDHNALNETHLKITPIGDVLKEAMRPKPPSLKEQALEALDRFRDEAWCEEIDFDLDIVLRALEQLDD